MSAVGSLPFQPDMVEAIRNQRKYVTTRPKRYPEGVYQIAPDLYIEVTETRRTELQTVARYWYDEEGFGSPEEFKAKWLKLHPRAGWRPAQKVWLHIFELVGVVE